MDVSQVGASGQSPNQMPGGVGVFVLKKAIESEGQGVAKLANSLPKPNRVPDPNATVGKYVDLMV